MLPVSSKNLNYCRQKKQEETGVAANSLIYSILLTQIFQEQVFICVTLQKQKKENNVF